MLLKCITLCWLMLNVQSQNQYNPDFLYYPDSLPSVVPLSVPSHNELDTTTTRKLFQNEISKRPTTTVQIEKSVESEYGSNFGQVPNNNQGNLLNNRQSTPTTPGREQFAIQRPPVSQQSDRPNVFQGTQNGQNKPEISLIRPSVAVPQEDLSDRPTLQQITIGAPSPSWTQDRQRPPQGPQDRQTTQQIPGGINDPIRQTGSVPLNAQNRPGAQQIQSNPPPNFNILTQQDAGFNKLLYSVTNFGVNLLKNIDAVHSGNVVVSPFSITSLLGLIQQGAMGQTQAQITNALQMSPEITASAYERVSQDVKSRSSRNILRVVNNMFISPEFAINRNFQSVAISSFNSQITSLSFVRPEQATRQINSWVASRTQNKIEELIAPGALDLSTQMVLVNAIYFKGLWEVPFRVESTKPREFHLSNGQTKTVQCMRMRKMFKTGVDTATNANVIVLPFERDEYHLMVIVPSQLMGMKSTLASLTDARLLSYISFPALDTELELPKFTIRADTDLTVLLKSMGITYMFRRDYSELDGVGAYGAESPSISSAVHSAVLSIDEQGGTAAAATAFAAVALSYDDPAVEFKVNRPFIAILWDQQSSLPLFMAKIEDPQQ